MALVNAQNQPSVYPKSHVGFDSITQQIEKKLLKRGFQFNIICVGTSCIFALLMQLWLTVNFQDKPAWENPLSSTPSSHRI